MPPQLTALVAVLVVWTVAILLVPDLRLSYEAPRARLVLNAINVGAAGFAATLAGLRFSVDGAHRWLFVSLGFAVIALNQAVFGLAIEPGATGLDDPAYLWLIARLAAGATFVAAAFSTAASEPSRAARVYGVWFVAAVATLSLAQGAVLAADRSLPDLVTGEPDFAHATGVARGVAAASFMFATIGVASFVVAALGVLLRWPDRERLRPWLAAIFVMAGFAHLHYAMVPTVFTTRVATGDVLRLFMSAALVVMLTGDIRRGFMAESTRARAWEEAYRSQRLRLDALEELDRAKVHVLRLLAHELAHPVAAIKTLGTSLIVGDGSLDGETRRRAAEAIVEQSDVLAELVERAPELDELRFDVAPAVRSTSVAEVLDQLPTTFAHLAGRLRIDASPAAERSVVRVDTVRLMQVFQNLLSNAERFSPEGSPITVSVECRSDDVIFSVTDRGSGIPADEAEAVFAPFVRSRTSEGVPGTGLGLHIVRAIVEAHGGQAWVARTHPGAGVAFTIPVEGGP
ncbi:MAG TPA: HAMP domain-containing sensor histidine kinase [Candidatus Limnocylindrales bacterium]|nr:HAMP domain-containing sensor histidine kinase [Candidatus Limnocylindrales bacterium]